MHRGFRARFITSDKGAARAPSSFRAVQYHLAQKLAFPCLKSETARRTGFEPLQRTGRCGPGEPRALVKESPQPGSHGRRRS